MPPTIKPLPGYTYEGRNGESNGENILVASGITIGFATIAVLLRTYVKARIVSLFGLEDYLVIFALLCAIARFIMFVLCKRRVKCFLIFELGLNVNSGKRLSAWATYMGHRASQHQYTIYGEVSYD